MPKNQFPQDVEVMLSFANDSLVLARYLLEQASQKRVTQGPAGDIENESFHVSKMEKWAQQIDHITDQIEGWIGRRAR